MNELIIRSKVSNRSPAEVQKADDFLGELLHKDLSELSFADIAKLTFLIPILVTSFNTVAARYQPSRPVVAPAVAGTSVLKDAVILDPPAKQSSDTRDKSANALECAKRYPIKVVDDDDRRVAFLRCVIASAEERSTNEHNNRR